MLPPSLSVLPFHLVTTARLCGLRSMPQLLREARALQPRRRTQTHKGQPRPPHHQLPPRHSVPCQVRATLPLPRCHICAPQRAPLVQATFCHLHQGSGLQGPFWPLPAGHVTGRGLLLCLPPQPSTQWKEPTLSGPRGQLPLRLPSHHAPPAGLRAGPLPRGNHRPVPRPHCPLLCIPGRLQPLREPAGPWDALLQHRGGPWATELMKFTFPCGLQAPEVKGHAWFVVVP